MYKMKVVLAVAANLFLTLTEPKCLSKYKKDAEFYRVEVLQINDKHQSSCCLHNNLPDFCSTVEMSRATDFAAEMPFRAVAVLNTL